MVRGTWAVVFVGWVLGGCAVNIDKPVEDLAFGKEARTVCIDYVDALDDRISECDNGVRFDGFDCDAVLYASKARAQECVHALPEVGCNDLHSCNSAFVFR